MADNLIELHDTSNIIKKLSERGGDDNQLLITRYLRVQVVRTVLYSLRYKNGTYVFMFHEYVYVLKQHALVHNRTHIEMIM